MEVTARLEVTAGITGVEKFTGGFFSHLHLTFVLQVHKGTWRGILVAIKTMILPANMAGAEKREKMVRGAGNCLKYSLFSGNGWHILLSLQPWSYSGVSLQAVMEAAISSTLVHPNM